jgi:hypothetical protein
MLLVEETKKRGNNVVAVVSSSFFSSLFNNLVEFILLQTVVDPDHSSSPQRGSLSVGILMKFLRFKQSLNDARS